MTAVHIAAMADPDHQNQHLFIPDLGHDPVVSDPILPKAGEVALERVAELSRVRSRGNPLKQVFSDSLQDRAINPFAFLTRVLYRKSQPQGGRERV